MSDIEREAFEKWVVSELDVDGADFTRSGDGEFYDDWEIQRPWRAWQAASAQGEVEAVAEGAKRCACLFDPSGKPINECIYHRSRAHPHNGEQLDHERRYSKALERRIADLEKAKGEQGEAWVRCDERLPTEADGFFVWSYSLGDSVCLVPNNHLPGMAFKGYSDYWMPTGLKRPAPPTEREGE